MALTLGDVLVTFKSDTSHLVRGAAEAKGAVESVGTSAGRASEAGIMANHRLAATYSGLVGHLNTVTNVAGILAVGGFGGLIAYGIKATQQVQGYVAGIRSLTKNSQEASDVIKGMIDYVQGKPFDRIEVLGAAQKLLSFGRTAQDVKGDVELLGRAVIVSGESWDNLSRVYGRVMSQGRLMTEDFNIINDKMGLGQQLSKDLGISMDDLRGRLADGSITAAQFHTAMEELLPADVVARNSNTITNKMLSLKTSMRNLAFEMLGVDFSRLSDSGMPLVKPGGLLDTLVTFVTNLTTRLRQKDIQKAFEDIGHSLTSMASTGLPLVIDGLGWLMTHMPEVVASFVALKATLMGMKLAMFVSEIGGVKNAVTALKVASSGGILIAVSMVGAALITDSLLKLKKANDDLKTSAGGAHDQVQKLNERINATQPGPARDRLVQLRDEAERNALAADHAAKSFSSFGGILTNFYGDLVKGRGPLGSFLRSFLDVEIAVTKMLVAFHIVPKSVLTDLERTRDNVNSTMAQTRNDAVTQANQTVSQATNHFASLPADVQAAIALLPPNVRAILENTHVGANQSADQTVADYLAKLGTTPGGVPGALAGVEPHVRQWLDVEATARAAGDKGAAAFLGALRKAEGHGISIPNPDGSTTDFHVGVFARGGLVKYLAEGGLSSLFRPRGTDTIPAMLSPGEYVMRKDAVDRLGVGMMDRINQGMVPTVQGQSGGDTYHVHMDGVLATSREQVRNVGETIVEAINESRRSRNKPQLGVA